VRHLPKAPVEVVRDWLLRHPNSLYHWDWLPLKDMAFQRVAWTTEKILKSVRSPWPQASDSWCEELLDSPHHQTSSLGSYMIREGTWPVPPLVFVRGELTFPDDALFKGVKLSDYSLVEGHHRLGYLRTLAARPRWTPQDEHFVWLFREPE